MGEQHIDLRVRKCTPYRFEANPFVNKFSRRSAGLLRSTPDGDNAKPAYVNKTATPQVEDSAEIVNRRERFRLGQSLQSAVVLVVSVAKDNGARDGLQIVRWA